MLKILQVDKEYETYAILYNDNSFKIEGKERLEKFGYKD